MPAGLPTPPGVALSRPAAFAAPGVPRLDASNYGLAAGVAPYLIGTSSSSGTASRVVTVAAVTDPGDGMVMVTTNSAAGVSITGASDSKGNTYTVDTSYTTTLPYLFGLRCDGATGGPGGGPTAQLVPGDTITVTNNGTSSTISIAVWCLPGGPALDSAGSLATVSAATALSASVTPAAGGELCLLLAVSQPAGGVPSFALPYVPGSTFVPATGAYPSLAAIRSGRARAWCRPRRSARMAPATCARFSGLSSPRRHRRSR
jgi:hypothetical protein